MNNAITQIKNTLEGTSSRITEAEDRISEVEDRMVEINEAERNKEKRIKRNEDNLRDLWDDVKHPTFESQKFQKKKTDYCTQHGSQSNMKEKSKAYRQAKAERIHHQTSSSTNAKGSSLDRKHRKGL